MKLRRQVFSRRGPYIDVFYLQIDTGGYPREISTWWLGCPDKSQIIEYDRKQAMKGSNKDTDIVLLNSNSRERGSDEQWITVQYTNVAFGQRNSAINQHFLLNNILFGLPFSIVVMFLLGFS